MFRGRIRYKSWLKKKKKNCARTTVVQYRFCMNRSREMDNCKEYQPKRKACLWSFICQGYQTCNNVINDTENQFSSKTLGPYLTESDKRVRHHSFSYLYFLWQCQIIAENHQRCSGKWYITGCLNCILVFCEMRTKANLLTCICHEIELHHVLEM